MELRKVEKELESLTLDWNALCRKRPRFIELDPKDTSKSAVAAVAADNAADAHAGPVVFYETSVPLPSWNELSAQIVDEDIFPPEPEPVEVEAEDDENERVENATAGSGPEESKVEDTSASIDKESMDVEDAARSMPLIDSSKDGGDGSSSGDKKELTESIATPTKQLKDERKLKKEEENIELEDETPQNILNTLLKSRESILELRPKMDRFFSRLQEKDPVTGKTRYGPNTAARVKNAIRTYKTLELGLSIAFDESELINENISSRGSDPASSSMLSAYNSKDPSIVSILRLKIEEYNQLMHAQSLAQQTIEQSENERLAKEQQLAEQRAEEQRLLEEKLKKEQERELAQRAQEARIRRAEEEQRALDAEREADRQLMALVPVKGAEGVRMQISRMREALKDDKAALDVALGSLYTLFDQIVRHPDEVNYRRVRRDHPKFMQDIGRHVGGREVLLAAGFRLEKLDGVPCFFSKEPHIESDMDGWSAWFDGLKKTVEILEEEMIK